MDSPERTKSDSDKEGNEKFPRKHGAVRRASEFDRFSQISVAVDEWFHQGVPPLRLSAQKPLQTSFPTIATHHREWARFHEENRTRSRLFFQSENFDEKAHTSLLEGDIEAKILHEEFCQLFEVQIQQYFLDVANLTQEEFAAVLKLSNDEEQRRGQHFYRWMDILDFEVFVEFMKTTDDGTKPLSPALPHCVERLLLTIREREMKAQIAWRKRTSIFPILIRWAPTTFAQVADTVRDAALLSAGITWVGSPPSLSLINVPTSTIKELAKWRLKLERPVLTPSGLYAPPPPNEVEWCAYIGHLCESFSWNQFERFSQILNETVNGFIANDESLLVNVGMVALQQDSVDVQQIKQRLRCAALRRAELECFTEFDDLKKGSVQLSKLVHFVAKAGLLSNGSFSDNAKRRETLVKKTELRWRATLRQRRGYATAVKEGIPTKLQNEESFSRQAHSAYHEAIEDYAIATAKGNSNMSDDVDGTLTIHDFFSVISDLLCKQQAADDDQTAERQAHQYIKRLKTLTEAVRDQT